MSDFVLETFGLTKRFGGLAAVNDVSLRVAPREVHAIIGPNGAGKSTMINLLSGHLKPCCGEIRFEGKNITQECEREQKKRLNFVASCPMPAPKLDLSATVSNVNWRSAWSWLPSRVSCC